MRCYFETDAALEQSARNIFTALRSSPVIMKVLEYLSRQDFLLYVAGSAIYKTVWNYQDGLPPLMGLNDIDVCYYDVTGTPDSERELEKTIAAELSCPIRIELRNQALMHLWRDITPYRSLDDAVSKFYSEIVCHAVRLEPYGLVMRSAFDIDDIALNRIIRFNKCRSNAAYDRFLSKVERCSVIWKGVTIQGT